MRKKSYEILFEDEEIIVINKASGAYTIEPRHKTDDPIIYEEIKKTTGDLFTVHRLDKDTSGLIVFAKTARSHKILSEQFRENKIEKTYYAFVEGNLDLEDSVYLIDIPILVTPGRYQVQISERGKPSQTKIRIVESYKNYTLIEAKLITGRTHQIRAHMQYLGYPLIVDKLYGHKKELFLSEIKRKYKHKGDSPERPLIKRQTLHSRTLSFIHPSTNEKLSFEAPLPKDLKALRNQLRKNS